MILNLGLVDEGGQQIIIDDPDFKLDGFIFEFNDDDSDLLKVRGWYNLNSIMSKLSEPVEVRLFMNSEDKMILSIGVRLLDEFRDKISEFSLLFNDGRFVTFNNDD